MNNFLNAILFIIGITVGFFLKTKTIEIPQSLDMKKTHYEKSKGEIWSILTYMGIGGISSIILAEVFKINVQKFDISNLIIYIFAMIYISILIIIAGIDRDYSKIEKRVLAFGIISSIVYMLYLCIVDLASIYLNGIYLAIYMGLLIIDTFLLRRYAKDSYIINTLLLSVVILVYTDINTLIYTIILALIAIILYSLLLKRQQKKNGNKKIKIKDIPIGYFIAASNIIVLFMIKILENYSI